MLTKKQTNKSILNRLNNLSSEYSKSIDLHINWSLRFSFVSKRETHLVIEIIIAIKNKNKERLCYEQFCNQKAGVDNDFTSVVKHFTNLPNGEYYFI